MEKFNKIFVNIGPNPSVNITLNETALSEDEFEESFKLLKRNKAPGYDGLDINIITSVYELIKEPQLKIFNELINLGIFPENMKIAKVKCFFYFADPTFLYNYFNLKQFLLVSVILCSIILIALKCIPQFRPRNGISISQTLFSLKIILT